MRYAILLLAGFLLALFSTPVLAEDNYVLVIKDHQLSPQTLDIPAEQKVMIIINNLDDTPAEVESSDLDREKLLDPHNQSEIYIGPLDLGS